MPSKKDGTAGNPDSPPEPGVALDAADAQAGGTETAPAEGVDHTSETYALDSASVGDEESDASESDTEDEEQP